MDIHQEILRDLQQYSDAQIGKAAKYYNISVDRTLLAIKLLELYNKKHYITHMPPYNKSVYDTAKEIYDAVSEAKSIDYNDWKNIRFKN